MGALVAIELFFLELVASLDVLGAIGMSSTMSRGLWPNLCQADQARLFFKTDKA